MGKLPEGDELDFWVEQVLNDTGALARNVLGMDTDRGADGVPEGEVGKGGIRNSGKHQQMVRFLDDFDTKEGVMVCPRKTYKSSLVEAHIARLILSRPNWCILLLMHDYEMACQRITVIRNLLQEHPIIRKLYGDISGKPLGRPWRKSEYTTALRTDNSLLDPQVKAASPKKMPTGGHYHVILIDDPIDFTDVTTPEAIDRAVNAFRFTTGLRAAGGIRRVVATPYAIGDVVDTALQLPGWKKLVLPVENDVVKREDGSVGLEGESGWPHLSNAALQLQLNMGFDYFMSQFKLRIVRGLHQPFQREQFTPLKWKKEHADLTGFLLTDVSTSERVAGCLNVLCYVGLDERNRLHILDLEVGHWPIGDFCDRYLSMLARWQARVTHTHEVLEAGSTNNGYKAMIAMRAKERGQRINIVTVSRGTADLSKEQRIMCLQPRFQGREVFVMDTVPTTWVDETGPKLLWDPEGYIDLETGRRLPAGELVDQFVRFQQGASRNQKKDIPDAIAQIDELDRTTGNRVCQWRRPLRARMPDHIVRGRSNAPTSGVASRFYARAVGKIRTT